MFSSEERRGLGFVVIGGLLLIGGALAALGFFSDSPRPAAPTPKPVSGGALALGGARGRVVDARSGAALAGRTVDVEGLAGLAEPWFSEVDPDQPAAFELHGLPSTRSCTLAIGCDGHVAVKRELRVESGQVVELGDVALVPLATISGTVVDTTGKPVARATVELAARSVECDASGAFRVERLAPTTYAISARADGDVRSIASVSVDATRGGECDPVRVVVAPTFALHGKFEWPKETPPPIGALLRFDWTDPPPPAPLRAEVAADGAFTFDAVRARRVRLVALVDAEHGVPFDLEAPFDTATFFVDPANGVALADALAR
jgi:hypothetical protein